MTDNALPRKYADAIKDGSYDSLHYTLPASTLAEAMTDALLNPKPSDGKDRPTPSLSPEQQLYARALLLNAAHTGAGILGEEASLRGTQARMISPAYSMSRVGAYESAVYDLIEAGKVEALQTIARPQIMTTTAHPNFSRSRELVQLSHKISNAIAELSPEEQAEIQRNGALPNTAQGTKISALLSELPSALHKREKRTRRDEMNETMIDFIPTIMKSADEQIALFKKRKKALSGGSKDEIDDDKAEALREEYGFERTLGKRRGNEAKYAKALADLRAQSSDSGSWQFTSTDQLDAAALLLPKYNSWGISDGDGKRTCHVYDTEMAIPALKRATLEEYSKTLKALHELQKATPKKPDGFNAEGWVQRLEKAERLLGNVESLAALRVDTVSAIQYIGDTYPDTTEDGREKREHLLYSTKLKDIGNSEISKTLKEAFPNLTVMEAAKKISSDYKTLITDDNVKEALGSMPVKDGNKPFKDIAQELKAELKTFLDQAYQHPEQRDSSLAVAENLYMKVSAYGNFAMRMQRRENAKEYTKTFYYLLQNTAGGDKQEKSLSIKKNIAAALELNESDLDETKLIANPALYDRVIKCMAESALSQDDPLHIKDALQKQFLALSNKMESRIDDRNPSYSPDNMAVGILQPREQLAVDDLGFFNMARRYPEAFDGFVIAEYAQPQETLLRDGTEAQVRDEVQRLAHTEFLTSLTFARAMGADKAEIIPLHEDPATMRWIPDAQTLLRGEARDGHANGPMTQYMLHYMGLDGDKAAENAEKKAVRYIDISPLMQNRQDASGTPNWNVSESVKKLTAYDEMRRLGYDDKTLENEAGGIERLKTMFILDGPTDMEACSDNSKRAGIIGAELAEQSVREKALQAAKHPVEIGGQLYMIRKPKYLGQGGAIARATEIPLDTVQATWQGEHPLTFVPKALAHRMYHSLLGRLYLNGEAGRGDVPDEQMQNLSAGNPLHLKHADGSSLPPIDVTLLTSGNMFGLPGYGMSPTQKAMMNNIVLERVKSTRDDPRYDDCLAKYGSPTLNYSARPPSKGAGTFSDKRAIGIAGEEAPMFTNTLALAAMLNAGKGEDAAYNIPHQSNIDDIRKWKDKDYSIQQRLTAAALISYFANPEKTWERGEGTYKLSEAEKSARHETLETLLKDAAELNNRSVQSPDDKQIRREMKGLESELAEAHEEAGQTDNHDTFVYHPETQSVSLKNHPEKGSVPIRDLAREYEKSDENTKSKKKERYEDPNTHIVFDAADLVMAHLTEQQLQLQEGLKRIYPGTKDPLSLFDPLHQEDMKATKTLYDDILTQLNATKPKNGEKKSKDRELLEGAYYLLFESGPGTVYPASRLADVNLQMKHAKNSEGIKQVAG